MMKSKNLAKQQQHTSNTNHENEDNANNRVSPIGPPVSSVNSEQHIKNENLIYSSLFHLSHHGKDHHSLNQHNHSQSHHHHHHHHRSSGFYDNARILEDSLAYGKINLNCCVAPLSGGKSEPKQHNSHSESSPCVSLNSSRTSHGAGNTSDSLSHGKHRGHRDECEVDDEDVAADIDVENDGQNDPSCATSSDCEEEEEEDDVSVDLSGCCDEDENGEFVGNLDAHNEEENCGYSNENTSENETDRAK